MDFYSKQLSRPKIQAFLKIFPFLKETYDTEQFIVDDAIIKINANSDLGVWCYKTNNYDRERKVRAEKSGLITLDLQNACHCFAGRGESKVVDKDTGQKYQLLDFIKKMTYRIKY